MKRIIKTYETCSDELLSQLAEKFPNGIKERHISQLTTIKGEKIRIVELQTDDAMYLIKFSPQLEEAIDNIDLEIEEDEVMIEDEDGLNTSVVNVDINELDEDIAGSEDID